MSQHDLDIANQGFPATRADINNALQALGSSNSGATAPSTTYANQLWYDTANNILKIRNEDNDAWISLLYLDQTNDAVAQFDVDNIRIDGNTISSTDTNGDITLDPDGTGDTIIASGNVGIGDTAPGRSLVVKKTSGNADVLIETGTGNASQLLFGDTDAEVRGYVSYAHSTDTLTLGSAGSDRITIKNNGNVAIGNTANAEVSGDNLVVGTGSGDNGMTIYSGTSDSGNIYFSDGTSGDNMSRGTIRYFHGDNTMRFWTNASRRMLIDSSGNLLVGKETSNNGVAGAELRASGYGNFTRSGDQPLFINRLSNDGVLVSLRQDSAEEGTISVSGSTVSYNGGHLSRWSQATDGNRISGLVKGTVMTNLDQMAVWHHEAQAATYYEEGDELPEGVSLGDEKTPAVAAYDENNEQLNCMAVSSVEGDANVAGVFVNFDDDDTDFTADMNVAMTGDMVIRIAQGTTVARGDLLMSAGDGTAKPQGDDIVRSKTIAKVTSTTVSHTYDDGSYLVPCVLMAC